MLQASDGWHWKWLAKFRPQDVAAALVGRGGNDVMPDPETQTTSAEDAAAANMSSAMAILRV